MIKLDKPQCPTCGGNACSIVNKITTKPDADIVKAKGYPHVYVSLEEPGHALPINDDNTLTVKCLDWHMWDTLAEGIPDPNRFRKRVEQAIAQPAAAAYAGSDMEQEDLNAFFADLTPSQRTRLGIVANKMKEKGWPIDLSGLPGSSPGVVVHGGAVDTVFFPEDGPEIHKLMVLSAAHITEQLDKEFHSLMGEDSAREVASGAYLEQTSFGWLIILNEQEDGDSVFDMNASAVCAYARKHGCTHLRLDRDGPKMKDLPTYEW